MKKNKIFFFLLIITLLSNILYSEISIPKLFGLNRRDEKKCIIISTINTDATLKSLLGPSFDDKEGVYGVTLLEGNLGKYIVKRDCTKKKNNSFYDRTIINIDSLLGKPNDNSDGILGELKNYSIIYFEAHANVGGMSIEHYLSEDESLDLFASKPDPSVIQKERDERKEKLAYYKSIYQPPGTDKDIYVYDGSLGWEAKIVNNPSITYAGTLGISTDLFERELPDLNNALVILGSCYGSRLAEIFLKKGASIVIANTGTTDTSVESILDSLCGLAFSRINYTIFEVYTHFCKNEKRGWQIYSKSENPESMDYVLYRQPRIESVVIESENQNSKEKKLIYDYKFPKDQNPQDKYPNEQLILSSQEGCPDKDKILYAKIEFSDPINSNKKATKLKKALFGKDDGYLFRLYACPLNKITDENKNFAEASNIKFVNNSTVTMTFDISKLNIESNPIVHLVVRALDTLNHDDMYYLDTIGRGRDDNMAECEVTADDKCTYQNGGIDFSDGLDINHWFDPIIPQFTIKTSEISKLHLPLIKNGPPPDEENEQPLASDGFIVYPSKEYTRFAPCYSMLPNNVSSTYCIMDVTQQISSEYMPAFYLNKELLESAKAEEQKKTIEELPDGDAAIINLKKTNYPSFVANLKTEATGKKDKQNQCVPLNVTGEDVSTMHPFISLKMKNYSFSRLRIAVVDVTTM